MWQRKRVREREREKRTKTGRTSSLHCEEINAVLSVFWQAPLSCFFSKCQALLFCHYRPGRIERPEGSMDAYVCVWRKKESVSAPEQGHTAGHSLILLPTKMKHLQSLQMFNWTVCPDFKCSLVFPWWENKLCCTGAIVTALTDSHWFIVWHKRKNSLYFSL